jgi:hypothetical protein
MHQLHRSARWRINRVAPLGSVVSISTLGGVGVVCMRNFACGMLCPHARCAVLKLFDHVLLEDDMGLSMQELLFVVVAVAAAGMAVRWTGRRWLVLLPLVALCAALVSPADLASTLLIAIPNGLLMGLAVHLHTRSAQPPTISA